MVKVCLRGDLLHAQDEILSGSEVPGLKDGFITAPFDRSGDPLRPIAVGSVVANENFRWLRSHVGLEGFLPDLSEFVT